MRFFDYFFQKTQKKTLRFISMRMVIIDSKTVIN